MPLEVFDAVIATLDRTDESIELAARRRCSGT
jgi:hypothetical protein